MAAKNYTEILALVNAGNQMGLSNTIKRDYGIPLDFTSVQPSFDDAVIYAAENTKAYVGQPLSVGGKLYIINDVAAAEKHVVGEKEYDNYLVEVGSATEGDGVTIDLDEGVLTLHGFESALTGYLPRKAEDGTLEWVPISAVVQGDGNKVTTLTSEDGSVTITKKTDTDESLVYDLSVEAYDDSDLQDRVKAIEDDYLKAEDKYDDSDLQDRVKAIEDDYLKVEDKYDDTALAARVKALEDEERYDETALANRVEALETVVGDAESGLVKDLADEIDRAVEAERLLSERIDNIDFIDETELIKALEPYALTADVEADLEDKADKTALEALEDKVNAFLTGEGTEKALDSLQELIAYIDEHDGADLTEMVATIEGIEKKLEGVDSTVAAHVTAAIDALKIGDYAKAADLTALANRVVALEAKPFDDYVTKSEVEAVEDKFDEYTTTSDLNDLLADKANADAVVSNEAFAEFQEANTKAIGAARTGAVADVAEVGYALADDVAETYATKQSVTDLGNTIGATLNDYAKTADIEAELAKKIEAATISHATEDKAEGATVTGTQLDIVVDAFTKAETRQYVADTIKTMTGGESAADVKLLLENHVADYTEKVGQLDAKDTTQDTAIAAAKAQADKGVADAKTANEAIVALTNGAVATNTSDITAIKGRLTTLETAKGDHETRLASAEGKITALEAEDVAINSAIGAIQGQIVALGNEDARLAGLIEALQANKADASSVYTKTEADKQISDAIAAIPAVDFTPYLKSEDAVKTYATISALETIYKAGEGDTEATGLLADEITRAKAAEKKIADDLALLIENPTEALDSVKELIEHVTEHGTEIAGVITRLDGHDTAIAQNASDIVAINNAIADIVQPKASAEVTVAEDGTLGIGTISTDKLVQGSETLVLNGGDATN